ncbi:hypothetical protein NFI96_008376 [Prochilodus magdalenae]|nr:hypothetical protein NFI96_008376 [Prochilodus magdalenae]
MVGDSLGPLVELNQQLISYSAFIGKVKHHVETSDEVLAAVMRSFRMAPPLPLLFLLMTVGESVFVVVCGFSQNQLSVVEYLLELERREVKRSFWNRVECEVQPAGDMCFRRIHSVYEWILYSPRKSHGRVEYLMDGQKHFSLRLSDVMKKDEHRYCFRIITNVEKERWMGYPGVELRVTDLQVEAPGEVTEGGTAVLTCNTTCSLTDPTFIWYKNGRPLTTKIIKNNQLHLQTVSSEDAGSYSCAVGGYQHLRSTDQKLRVRYPPKNVSVSISGEIVEGSSVNLTCSSDGNPAVKNYTWFKERGSSPVGSGHRYSPLQSGSYYCEAQNEHGAQISDPVLVDLNDLPTSRSVILYVAVGVGLCGTVVFLSVFFWIRIMDPMPLLLMMTQPVFMSMRIWLPDSGC